MGLGIIALELNDRAVAIAKDGAVLDCWPSAVFDGTSGSELGAAAWREIRVRPRAVSTRHLGTLLTQRRVSATTETLVLAELQRRLGRELGAREGLANADAEASGAEANGGEAGGAGANRAEAGGAEGLWIVTPAVAEPVGLSALLGVAGRVPVAVQGFIDGATVTTAALAPGRNAIVVEVGLHHVAATAVECDEAWARRRKAIVVEGRGLVELYQAWLELISSTMVRRTRFDPLHDAVVEQQVFDSIPSLAREAAVGGSVTAAVTKGKDRFEVELTRDQFAHAAEPIYRSIIGVLHQLRPAGAAVALVMPEMVAQLPGMRELLEQFVGCELIGVADGFAAAAASVMELPQVSSDEVPRGTVRLFRRMPVAPMPLGSVAGISSSLGSRRVAGPAPSHVLWEGRAYSLTTAPVVVGRAGEVGVGAGIRLPEGLAAVSRRHCSFVQDGDQVVLMDHSTFGTYVNGERIYERVQVHAGDRVRIGEPGVELSLIAVGEAEAPTQLMQPTQSS